MKNFPPLRKNENESKKRMINKVFHENTSINLLKQASL